MANDSVLEKKSDGTTVPSPPIIVPAHKPLSHTAQEISDRIDAELSRKNLLIAAHGGMSPRAAAIKDYRRRRRLSTNVPKITKCLAKLTVESTAKGRAS